MSSVPWRISVCVGLRPIGSGRSSTGDAPQEVYTAGASKELGRFFPPLIQLDMRMILTISGALLLAGAAFAQPRTSITVDGGNGNTAVVALADLAKLTQYTIKAVDHGAGIAFEGVLLSDVLAKVQAPVGEKLRGKALTGYLLVEAADGYRVVFALAELDPAFSDKRVYLATKRDGKPLGEKEGPFRIVAPDEKRPARWVRQVTALKIEEAP